MIDECSLHASTVQTMQRSHNSRCELVLQSRKKCQKVTCKGTEVEVMEMGFKLGQLNLMPVYTLPRGKKPHCALQPTKRPQTLEVNQQEWTEERIASSILHLRPSSKSVLSDLFQACGFLHHVGIGLREGHLRARPFGGLPMFTLRTLPSTQLDSTCVLGSAHYCYHRNIINHLFFSLSYNQTHVLTLLF